MGQDVLVTVKGYPPGCGQPAGKPLKWYRRVPTTAKTTTYYLFYRETSPHRAWMIPPPPFKSDGRTVTVIRNGSVSMRQVFEPGQSHRSVYQTGFSSMETVICPWQIEVDLTEHGGSIKLEYELVLAGVPAGTNSLEITVKKLLPASKS
ncbi:DUF1934 domain-containing protein [Desulforamulus hydrothermalis]|uniref:DUF1934 domain-containing protein n=1 Tax=Desulforamulus hydrothermalis TaxID=412895 RepID=UPI0009E646FD|nr:DUF1934 domain-containing protein [Desulforamulus hydrothermalis]